jgi:large subunit ribosomal protein L15
VGGFKNPTRVEYEVINLRDLEKLEPGSYDILMLKELRLVGGRRQVKILGEGMLTKKLELKVDAVSRKAKEGIEKAGGKVLLV